MKIYKIYLLFIFLAVSLLILKCSNILDTQGEKVATPKSVVLKMPDDVYASFFSVSWNKSHDDYFGGYRIIYDSIPNVSINDIVLMETNIKNDTIFKFHGVVPGRVYYIKVFVLNQFSYSESNEIKVETPNCSCGEFGGATNNGMVLIPAGCFVDSGGYAASISSDFFIDTTEITQTDWYSIMHDSSVTSMKPKTNVSWFQLILFCNKKSIKHNFDSCYTFDRIAISTQIDTIYNLHCDFLKNGYRLPTEDEWEYAYRAGTTTDYFWGKNIHNPSYPSSSSDSSEIDNYVWWQHNNTTDESYIVATKKPNNWRLYDMAGNVDELIWNQNAPYPNFNRFNYTGETRVDNWDRVRRSGNYYNNPFQISAYFRTQISVEVKSNNQVGFRTVRTKTN